LTDWLVAGQPTGPGGMMQHPQQPLFPAAAAAQGKRPSKSEQSPKANQKYLQILYFSTSPGTVLWMKGRVKLKKTVGGGGTVSACISGQFG
jgi:hypothetical protein